MTKTKTKTKTKSLTKTTGSFPVHGWQYDMEYCIELPRFFASAGWQTLAVPPPPDADETAEEIEQLLEKQRIREADGHSYVRDKRMRDIVNEAGGHDPEKIMRLLMMPPGGGGLPATYMLMEGMIVLGKIVVAHFKNQFMRPRPSQLDPRLRPMIDIPGHPAYPSGHSLQMFLVAKALSTIVRSHELGGQLFEVAEEIAVNREWAGVHFASDTRAGKDLAFNMFPVVLDAYAGSFHKAAQEWL